MKPIEHTISYNSSFVSYLQLLYPHISCTYYSLKNIKCLKTLFIYYVFLKFLKNNNLTDLLSRPHTLDIRVRSQTTYRTGLKYRQKNSK